MSNSIKKLAGQTAVYGVSSIIGRLLNYLLVPLYTRYFIDAEYGVIAHVYAYVAFLIVILTYGMESAFFRFSQNEKQDKHTIFGTTLFSLITTSSIFIAFVLLFSKDIAGWLRYPNHPEYIIWMGIIIGFDAISSIPFAKLRAENRPLKFAFIKLVNIGVNIGLNLFFIVLCPLLLNSEHESLRALVSSFYSPEVGVGYVFISNLIASVVSLLLLIPVMLDSPLGFSLATWRRMMIYALPLLVAGLAGIVNETLDKILFVYLLPEDIAMSHLGIYSACYKLSILMALFIQAFRFAAEPFFFAESQKANAREVYALVMKVFVVACLFIFLGIMLYMDLVQHFVGRDYRAGLRVVPILLMAQMFLGIYFNLSIWYKLTGQTRYGAYIAIIGASVTIIMNVLLLPVVGYIAAAWTHLTAYLLMTLISWFWGQKYFPVPYETGRIFLFIIVALGVYGLSILLPPMALFYKWPLHAVLIVLFGIGVLIIDKELRNAFLRLVNPILKNRLK